MIVTGHGQRAALDEHGELVRLRLGEVPGDVGATALDADVALHASFTCGELMTSPSSTIATRRVGSPGAEQAAVPVRSSQTRPPSPLKSMDTM
jgi:hypothetical protein